jgi:alginate O-acetyltransferase complex protein AlgI
LLFTEPTFLFLFLPVLLALYFITRSREHGAYANWLLLIASVIFYATGGGSFTWLMLGSIAFNYWMAILVSRDRRWLGFAIAANLVVLGLFKYANFIADNVNALLSLAGAPPIAAPRVLLPIGISFFTFHAISYVVDVYRRDATAQKSPVHAALYLLLFPQLIAGPIIRWRDIAAQLIEHQTRLADFAYGARRFILGLGKKTLIANTLGRTADAIFALPGAELTAPLAWLGLVCYTLQIYFDFSGYSDMAIGLGRMFGFRFPENFRWPYIAGSVQEFWRRWHISLSTWFRDYLYIPLGGNRVAPARRYRNLVAVFFLCGLWHGASWNFVIWGLWHGAFLVVERITFNRRGPVLRQAQDERPLMVSSSNHAISADSAVKSGFLSWPIWPHVYTMLVVVVGWVFFRAETLPGALAFLKAMAGATIAAPTMYTVWWYLTPELWLALIAGAIGSAPWVPALAARIGRAERPRLEWTAGLLSTASLMALLVASIVSLAARTYKPVIYLRL